MHIIAEESRIFKTKERCPLLLCIEVYRPTEIALEQIPEALAKQREFTEVDSQSGKMNNYSTSSVVVKPSENDSANLDFSRTRVDQAKGKRSISTH